MGGVELSLTSLKMGAIDKDYFGDGCLASCACGSRSGPLGVLARRTFALATAACEAVGAGARSNARSAEAVVLLFLGGVIAGGGLALVGGVRRCGECRRHEHRADNAPWVLDGSSRGLLVRELCEAEFASTCPNIRFIYYLILGRLETTNISSALPIEI